jgi:hypothetical protein
MHKRRAGRWLGWIVIAGLQLSLAYAQQRNSVRTKISYSDKAVSMRGDDQLHGAVKQFATFRGDASVHYEPKMAVVRHGLTVLTGANASIHGGIKQIDMGPGKVGWIEPWKTPDDVLTWTIKVAATADYEISAILQGNGIGCTLDLRVGTRNVNAPCTEKKWDRIGLGLVKIPAGVQTISLRSTGSAPLNKFFSLEVVTPKARKAFQIEGLKTAADTSWMVAAKYGLMFHWTSESKPETGPPKFYCEAVREFNVPRFADMVAETGAGYVVFTTSHAGFYFPGPNKAIDEVLPGRTCPIDLVGNLAEALSKRGIKLVLYFHPGHDDAQWWKNTHFDDDKDKFFDLWCKIIGQTGKQYGNKVAGWWFDDAAFTYYPFNAPWRRMNEAAKAGNPNRLITFNSWILPKLNDSYEVFAGENSFSKEIISGDGFLLVGGTGKFTGGPQAGLQGQITTIINGDWGHFKTNTPIGPPMMSSEVTIGKLKDAISRRNVPTFDLEIYQDGTISPQTLAMFKAIRREIKPTQSAN